MHILNLDLGYASDRISMYASLWRRPPYYGRLFATEHLPSGSLRREVILPSN